MKRFLVLYGLIWVFSFSSSHAQFTSVRGWFEVDAVKGCVGLPVNVTITASAPGICYSGLECDTFWGDGTQDKELSHTYTESGSYYLRILFDNSNGYDSIEVNVTYSQPPSYNVYSCTGQRVEIDLSDSEYDNYVIDYDDGFQETIMQGDPDPIHAYGSSVDRTISIRGLNDGAVDNCPVATNNITPLNILPPGSITAMQVISEDQLVIDYNLQEDILYELQISPNNNGTFSKFKDITTQLTTDTLTGLDLTDNFFCFRLATQNACDNTTESLSPVVCSISLNLTAEDNVNELNWIGNDAPMGFTLCKNGNCDITISSTNRDYSDTDITCNTDYCYTLIGNYSGATSTSVERCITSFSTTPPDEINNISTEVVDNEINISWTQPVGNTVAEYQIRKETNGSFGVHGTSTTTEYTASGLNPETIHCFQVWSADECGNQTNTSITACSLFLSGIIDKENNIALTWNEYTGYQNGVANYTIRKQYADGSETSITSPDPSFSETDNNNAQQVISYTIIANPNEPGVAPSASNTFIVIKPANVHFPNAFTPDGNGTNDIFMARGRFITSYSLKVFNRWGEMVFYSDNMDAGWDGTNRNGKRLLEGTYAFRLDMTDQAGRKIEKEGTIYLLRK